MTDADFIFPTAEERRRMTWVTNSPEAAEALRRADKRYTEARDAEKHLPLAQKVQAYRAAKARREADYILIQAGAYDRV